MGMILLTYFQCLISYKVAIMANELYGGVSWVGKLNCHGYCTQ